MLIESDRNGQHFKMCWWSLSDPHTGQSALAGMLNVKRHLLLRLFSLPALALHAD